ncbi:MAG: sensor domain-containing diguanylate cyclase [Thermoleophilia bacterium]
MESAAPAGGMTRLGPAVLDDGLRALLERQPRCAVAAIGDDGMLRPVPASVVLDGHDVIAGHSALDLVPSEHRPALVECWIAAKTNGFGVASVRLNDGAPVNVTILDLTPVHGAYIVTMQVAEDATRPEPSPADVLTPIIPRFAVVSRNEIGRIVAPDQAFSLMMGREPETYVDVDANALIHPDDYARAVDCWLDMMAQPGTPQRFRGRYLRGDGRWLWVEVTNHQRLTADGHIRSEFVDISEEMEVHEALRRRERLLDRITEAFPLGIIQVDPDERVALMNAQARRLLGGDALSVAEIARLVVRDDRAAFLEAVGGALTDGVDRDVSVAMSIPGIPEHRFRRFELRGLREDDGGVVGIVGSIADITEHTLMQRELQALATLDGLTGCHNRASIMSVLRRVLAHHGPAELGTAVMFIDLDGFKGVNDRHGHTVGDRLLREVAERLRSAVRAGDVVGRMGGDEFIVVLPNVRQPSQAVEVAERVASQVPGVLRVNHVDLQIRVSVGVAWSTNDNATAESLIEHADRAMYDCKRAGTGHPVLHDQGRGTAN